MKKCKHTIKEVTDIFYNIESRHKPLNYTIKNTYFWPLIRFTLYKKKILQELNIYAEIHPAYKRKVPASLSNIVKEYIFKNPFFSRKCCDYILFPHERKINGVDIYSKQLLDEVGDKTLVIEKPGVSPQYGAKILRGNTTKIIKRFFKKIITFESAPLLGNLEQDIKRELGCKIDVHLMVRDFVLDFKINYFVYKLLFRLKKPKRIFIVVAYARPYITAAAQSLGIPVTEIQHGTITSYNMGYSYPGRPIVPYQPDELLCFGRFWPETTDLPGQMRTRVIGAPFIRELSKEHNTNKKDPLFVLFASQGPIGAKLFPIAIECANLLPDYKITYRLHPSEIREDYEQIYSDYLEEHKLTLNNFYISDKSEGVTTYELMAQATYKLGVSSTTLYEGMVLGCRTIVVDLPGSAYLEPVLEHGDAILAGNSEEIARRLKEAPLCNDPTYYYAPPVSIMTCYQE